MKVLIIILFSLIFISCSESKQVSKEDCQKFGKTYKSKKTLNYRTGLYEQRGECI